MFLESFKRCAHTCLHCFQAQHLQKTGRFDIANNKAYGY